MEAESDRGGRHETHENRHRHRSRHAGTPPHAHAATFSACPSGRDGVIDGTPTSCAFADNVRIAWFGQPGNPVPAYSPVTNAYYSMTCVAHTTVNFIDGHSADAVLCVGGNDATVVVW